MSGMAAKSLYASQGAWKKIGNPREIAAYGLIRSLFRLGEDEIHITGFGTMDGRELQGFASIDDAFDFEVPSLGLIFEVTGSDYTLAQSLIRSTRLETYEGPRLPPEPHLFFRSGKVEKARLEGVVRRLVFVSVNEKVDTRFVPCSWLVHAPAVKDFEFPGCEPYCACLWHRAMLGEALVKKVEGK